MDAERHLGRTAIVTGAASGIGAATATRLIAEGASVVLADLDRERLEETANGLGAGARVATAIADVTDEDAVTRLVADAVERFAGLDIVVNNAGIPCMGHVDEVTPERWRRVMEVNVESVFLVSRAALPHLLTARGSIVNTASISGLQGDYGLAAYATSKAAVVNLTRNMAIDHAPAGIRVNCVCPGPVRTPILEALLADPEMVAAYAETIPLARPGEPEEVAAAISFLASAEASYVTGHTLVVDGGVTAATGQPNFRSLVWPKVEAARERRRKTK